MRPIILLSNDDGYYAQGISILYKKLMVWADVILVAPETNQSASSNSLTLDRPLKVTQMAKNQYAINGGPADCVHVALTSDLFPKPDLVISGINNGMNMGEDTIYSGTVAAAMEGFLFGIPSMALSLTQKGYPCLNSVACFSSNFIRHMYDHSYDEVQLLNVNIPPVDDLRLEDVALTRLGRRYPSNPVVQSMNPRGDTFYWVGSAGQPKIADEGTDFYAISKNKVSVTPLQIDLTDHIALNGLKNIFGQS
ncbi:MAG: 5'/3'-nucleotidase SurE [Alcaligenaceae bacterium]|nr:5'/3'-nucleotidase SurE [Alcaligenaceae bacterium]